MALTAERAQILGDYLVTDAERAKRLVELPAEEAVKLINADRHDFTVEELKEFAEAANKAAEMQAKDGELSEEELGEVAGGSLWLWRNVPGLGRAIVRILGESARRFAW